MHKGKTYQGSWERRTAFPPEVRNADWMSRKECLDSDAKEQADVTLTPRQMCGGKCETAQASCGGSPGQSGEVHGENFEWGKTESLVISMTDNCHTRWRIEPPFYTRYCISTAQRLSGTLEEPQPMKWGFPNYQI